MARTPTYGEPTKMYSKRVPESHIDRIEKLVCDYLSKIKPKGKPEVKISVKDNLSGPVEKINAKLNTVQGKQNVTVESVKLPCGCTIEKGLLRKPKNSPCKLTKLEHETLK